MKKYNIPTPADVDYYQEKILESHIEFVIQRIVDRNFEFVERDRISDFIPRINAIIKEYGWKIQSIGSGLKDDYQISYIIKPLNAK